MWDSLVCGNAWAFLLTKVHFLAADARTGGDARIDDGFGGARDSYAGYDVAKGAGFHDDVDGAGSVVCFG